jgi:MFS family permease
VASPLRRALAQPRFRRLFWSQTISRWGDTFSAVALVVLVFRLTGSGLSVAITVALEVVPVLVFGLVAGAVVDRFPRVRVMVVADVGRAAIALALALFGDELAVVYAAAFGLSTLTTFFNPAASSVVPALVDRDDMVGANSALWSAAVVSQIALAPLAGGLVALAGAGPAFALNAASFVVSALLLAGLSVPASAAPLAAAAEGPARRLEAVRAGLAAVRKSRLLTTLAGVQALAALSAGATSALLVVLAERHLDVGPGRFGLLLGAIGIGAGLGPLVLQRFVTDVRRPALLFGPYLLRGAVDLVLAAFSSFGLALGALAVYGVGTSTGHVTYQTVLQTTVPDRIRGRVFALYDMVWQSARLVSIGAGGLAADALGIRAVYLLGGALLIGAGVLGLVAVPAARLRGDDHSASYVETP